MNKGEIMFKLNKFEKFVIRHYSAMVVAYFVIITALMVINDIFEGMFFTIPFLLMIVAYFGGLFVITIPSRKIKQINEFSNVALDINHALDACNQIIEATNQKSTKFLPSYCIYRIICLINIGDFDRAENQIRLFWQHFNLKKVVASDLATTHILMANIALEKGNIQLFNEEMRIVNEYRSNSKLFGIFKRLYNYNLTDITLYAEAYFANENSNAQDFEARVFAHMSLDETTGKKRKKNKMPSPMVYFSAYNRLFIFYKNQGDSVKATYYAQQLVNIGNEQLSDYRKAKEYLENENSSN